MTESCRCVHRNLFAISKTIFRTQYTNPVASNVHAIILLFAEFAPKSSPGVPIIWTGLIFHKHKPATVGNMRFEHMRIMAKLAVTYEYLTFNEYSDEFVLCIVSSLDRANLDVDWLLLNMLFSDLMLHLSENVQNCDQYEC